MVLRCIHASADFDYAENLRFTPGAIEKALEALKGGAHIVTDTNMALAGISKPGLKALGGQVSRVVIDRVEGSTFFATLYVRCANGMFTRVDARPSDAIALAIRSNAPLYVEDDVFEVASCPRAFGAGDDEKIELEEFDKFIEDIEPDDFVTHGGFNL